MFTQKRPFAFGFTFAFALVQVQILVLAFATATTDIDVDVDGSVGSFVDDSSLQARLARGEPPEITQEMWDTMRAQVRGTQRVARDVEGDAGARVLMRTKRPDPIPEPGMLCRIIRGRYAGKQCFILAGAAWSMRDLDMSADEIESLGKEGTVESQFADRTVRFILESDPVPNRNNEHLFPEHWLSNCHPFRDTEDLDVEFVARIRTYMHAI